VATVFGNAVGMFLVSVLVAIGLGPVLQSSKAFYYAVQLAGGLYLIYLGYAAIAASKSDAKSMTNTDGLKPSIFTSIRKWFLGWSFKSKINRFLRCNFASIC
jgi:threonine/homoserine/homoserine lactone efflux protein